MTSYVLSGGHRLFCRSLFEISTGSWGSLSLMPSRTDNPINRFKPQWIIVVKLGMEVVLNIEVVTGMIIYDRRDVTPEKRIRGSATL